IKVLREKNGWTQAKLAEEIKTTQTVISRIENVNYSAWNISTLKKLARAFRVRLKVSFETYGSLIDDVENFSREALDRFPREKDPVLLYGRPSRRKPAGSIRLSPGMDQVVDENTLIQEDAAIKNGKLIQIDRGLRTQQPEYGLNSDTVALGR
ncbi:MAG TPA: helix-turn-helix transcriptional regulator, partial [Bryobacteraceae bacterium]|nr:helix-turn-helix transcriptional regulator [Bryobacteraceae bacterium]